MGEAAEGTTPCTTRAHRLNKTRPTLNSAICLSSRMMMNRSFGGPPSRLVCIFNDRKVFIRTGIINRLPLKIDLLLPRYRSCVTCSKRITVIWTAVMFVARKVNVVV